jgi:hypothetical protein
VGEIPRSAFDFLARRDDATRQLAAAAPAVERLSRCMPIRDLLSDLHATHCPKFQLATQLVFAVRTATLLQRCIVV